MAYVLGLIFADGCLLEHKNGHHGLDITSKNKDLLLSIKSRMQSGHKIGQKTRGWHLQIRNAKIYKDLLALGLTPNYRLFSFIFHINAALLFLGIFF